MNRRWIAGIAALLIVLIIVVIKAQPSIEPAPAVVAAATIVDAAIETEIDAGPVAPSGPSEPRPTESDALRIPPRPRVREDVAPPLPIPVAAVAPITTPTHENVAGLARQVCARTAAGDAEGLTALFGPGWSGHIPMDELRIQCSGDPTSALLSDGEYGPAARIFDEAAVRHWATESGLDAEHCVGLHLGHGRVMSCRDDAGVYRIAVVDFRAPLPPEPEQPIIPPPDR